MLKNVSKNESKTTKNYFRKLKPILDSEIAAAKCDTIWRAIQTLDYFLLMLFNHFATGA